MSIICTYSAFVLHSVILNRVIGECVGGGCGSGCGDGCGCDGG